MKTVLLRTLCTTLLSAASLSLYADFSQTTTTQSESNGVLTTDTVTNSNSSSSHFGGSVSGPSASDLENSLGSAITQTANDPNSDGSVSSKLDDFLNDLDGSDSSQ